MICVRCENMWWLRCTNQSGLGEVMCVCVFLHIRPFFLLCRHLLLGQPVSVPISSILLLEKCKFFWSQNYHQVRHRDTTSKLLCSKQSGQWLMCLATYAWNVPGHLVPFSSETEGAFGTYIYTVAVLIFPSRVGSGFAKRAQAAWWYVYSVLLHVRSAAWRCYTFVLAASVYADAWYYRL